jgi:hypothetical protein
MLEAWPTIACPYCWQPQEIPVDCTAGSQTLVVDCEVCCQPMELRLTVERGELVHVEALRAQ